MSSSASISSSAASSSSSPSSSVIAVVTGASGYIAGVLIEHLLSKGYTVHGTVRSLTDTSKLQPFLEAFSSAIPSKRLQLFEADLHRPGSFADAIKGAKFVFHTASPVVLAKLADAQKELVDAAVNGTVNVLTTAFAEPSVERIIVTSSIAAVRRFVPEGATKVVFSETDWNSSATMETAAYPFSKVQAEKKAWQLFEEHQKNGGTKRLIVVNPSWVFGPPVHFRSARDSESLHLLISYFDGSFHSRGAPTLRFSFVDVRDVADIHIAAAETPNAHGRYFATHVESYNALDWAEMLGKWFPGSVEKFPNKLMEGARTADSELDTRKTEEELRVKLRPLEQTFRDTVELLKKFRLIQQ